MSLKWIIELVRYWNWKQRERPKTTKKKATTLNLPTQESCGNNKYKKQGVNLQICAILEPNWKRFGQACLWCVCFFVALFVFYFLRAKKTMFFSLFLIRLWLLSFFLCSDDDAVNVYECVWLCLYLYVKPVCILLREINHLAN